jgi:hypothetical protein
LGGRETCTGFRGGNAKKKELLGRPRQRWEDNIKMVQKEIRQNGVDCIHLAQSMNKWRAVVSTVIKL